MGSRALVTLERSVPDASHREEGGATSIIYLTPVAQEVCPDSGLRAAWAKAVLIESAGETEGIHRSARNVYVPHLSERHLASLVNLLI